MVSETPSLVPELDVADLDRSLAVHTQVFGFRCQCTRPEERFVYLVLERTHLMLVLAGSGRQFLDVPMEYPFGRGVNFQIEVWNVDDLYASVQRSNLIIRVPLEERWYRQDQTEAGNRQFVVSDPDGYLLRFFGDLGRRPASAPAE